MPLSEHPRVCRRRRRSVPHIWEIRGWLPPERPRGGCSRTMLGRPKVGVWLSAAPRSLGGERAAFAHPSSGGAKPNCRRRRQNAGLRQAPLPPAFPNHRFKGIPKVPGSPLIVRAAATESRRGCPFTSRLFTHRGRRKDTDKRSSACMLVRRSQWLLGATRSGLVLR